MVNKSVKQRGDVAHKNVKINKKWLIKMLINIDSCVRVKSFEGSDHVFEAQSRWIFRGLV